MNTEESDPTPPPPPNFERYEIQETFASKEKAEAAQEAKKKDQKVAQKAEGMKKTMEELRRDRSKVRIRSHQIDPND